MNGKRSVDSFRRGTILAAAALLLSASGLYAQAQSRPARGPDPMIGKAAPDFELPLLKEETDAKGQKVNRISDEKVKLSSMFGKKVIVLFMSSYT